MLMVGRLFFWQIEATTVAELQKEGHDEAKETQKFDR